MTLAEKVEWIRDEPQWVGPSDEISHWFESLVAAASAGGSMFADEVEEIAKWAWDVQMETITWLYQEDYDPPEKWGMPSKSEWDSDPEEMYERIDDVRTELWWAERQLHEAERRVNEVQRK